MPIVVRGVLRRFMFWNGPWIMRPVSWASTLGSFAVVTSSRLKNSPIRQPAKCATTLGILVLCWTVWPKRPRSKILWCGALQVQKRVCCAAWGFAAISKVFWATRPRPHGLCFKPMAALTFMWAHSPEGRGMKLFMRNTWPIKPACP